LNSHKGLLRENLCTAIYSLVNVSVKMSNMMKTDVSDSEKNNFQVS